MTDRKAILLPLLAAAALTLSGLSLYISLQRPLPAQTAETAPPPALHEAAAPYLVRENAGLVAVFSGSGQLLYTTDSPVALLPRADRDALASGIPILTKDALAMLLEDLQP